MEEIDKVAGLAENGATNGRVSHPVGAGDAWGVDAALDYSWSGSIFEVSFDGREIGSKAAVEADGELSARGALGGDEIDTLCFG